MTTLHKNAKDLSGIRFGRAVALRAVDRVRKASGGTRLVWECACDCGAVFRTVTDNLSSGRTKSCGCYFREMLSKHPHALGKPQTKRVQSAVESGLMEASEATIPGFPLYTVTPDGYVYSYRAKKGGPRNALTHVARRAKSGAVYSGVNLFLDGKNYFKFVHQLVAICFLPPPRADQKLVRHLDGNPQNNHVSNLAWGNAKENEADKRRHGRNLARGRHPMAKLTEQKVALVRQAHEAGYDYARIAKFMGVSKSAIGMIIRGENWAETELEPA